MTRAPDTVLVLRLKNRWDGDELPVQEWAIANKAGAILRGPFALPTKISVADALTHPELSELRGQRSLPTLIFCHNPELAVRSVAVPAKGQEQFRKAVAFALEDALAGEVETLQFALPNVLKEGLSDCVYASKNWLETLRASLRELGVRAPILIPECLLLPDDSLLLERRALSYRLGPHAQGSIEPDVVVPLLRQRMQNTGPSPVTLYHAEQLQLTGLPAFVKAEPQSYVLHFLLQQLAQITASGTLPGNVLGSANEEAAQTPATAQKTNAIRRWGIGLTALAAGLAIFGFALRFYQLKQQSASQIVEISGQFQKVYPNLTAYQGAALDPVGMLLSQLRRDASASAAQLAGGVLTLLNFAAPVLATETRVTLVNMEYRNGQLELALRAPDLLTLDELRERFSISGNLRAQLGNNIVDPSGKMLTGRIQLSLATAPTASSTSQNAGAVP